MSLILNGDTGVQGNSGAFVAGTAVASTSGTSIDFTGIPSWVKRVTVMFSGVSLSGTSNVLVQLGDSGGIETTGYTSYVGETPSTTSTAGFVGYLAVAARTLTGSFVITLLGNNLWICTGITQNTSTSISQAGNKTLSDTLTQVRITTVNGTDTFDAGTINILYE